jgi:hypothetical protein
MLKWLHKAQTKFYFLMLILELGISALIVVGIAVSLLKLPKELMLIQTEGLSTFVRYMYDILISIELIKLIVREDLSAIVEILMFAVSRQVIIGHLGVTENLLAVAAIAVLFAIRKYLFTHHETAEEDQKRQILGSSRETDL